MADDLTHIDADGEARMVDVSSKATTQRAATARGFVYMQAATLETVRAGNAAKGDVLGTARLAGIMAAKKTGELIPLCHPLGLSHVEVRFAWCDGAIGIEATARCEGKTGVEMEALTAVTVAALTIYDMTKGADREVVIGDVHLAAKSGGRSGDWERPDAPGPAAESWR